MTPCIHTPEGDGSGGEGGGGDGQQHSTLMRILLLQAVWDSASQHQNHLDSERKSGA